MKSAVVATSALSLNANSLSDDLLADALLPENGVSTLTILMSSIGSGKTTLCGRLLALAAARSLPVGGVYSPAVIAGAGLSADDDYHRSLAGGRKTSPGPPKPGPFRLTASGPGPSPPAPGTVGGIAAAVVSLVAVLFCCE